MTRTAGNGPTRNIGARRKELTLRLAALARRQHGLVTRAQVFDLGFRRGWIHRELEAGRLVRIHESVYRLRDSPTSREQLLLAACFAGGQQRTSVGSHRAALFGMRLPGGDETIEITSPRWRRARHDGVVVHESLILEDRDVHYIDEIPITRPARTLCDAASLVVAGELDRATLELAILEGYRRGLVDEIGLRQEFARLGGTRRLGGELMETVIDAVRLPSTQQQSTPESMALLAIRRAGLPEPVTQHRVWVSPTRWFDLDLAWPQLRYAWEVSPWWYHGRTRERNDRDGERRLLLRALGWDYDTIVDAEIDAGFPLAIENLRAIVRRCVDTTANSGSIDAPGVSLRRGAA